MSPGTSTLSPLLSHSGSLLRQMQDYIGKMRTCRWASSWDNKHCYFHIIIFGIAIPLFTFIDLNIVKVAFALPPGFYLCLDFISQ